MPVDLRTFRLEQWLVLEDAKLPADDPRSCSDECYRRQEAARLWGQARSSWAKEHGWPGGTVARLREEVQARRAARQRREDQDATG